MAILSCHVSIKLPPKISDGQQTCGGAILGGGSAHHRSVPDLAPARAPRPHGGTEVLLPNGTRGCPQSRGRCPRCLAGPGQPGGAYEDLPRTIPELHTAMEYPDIVDPDGKFVRREDGVIVFTFSDHSGKAVDEVARTDPGFLEWMLKKDFTDEAKTVAREALARQRAQQAIPIHVD